MKPIQHMLGFLELVRIGFATGFRPSRHPYWAWREETAFGHDPNRMPSAETRRKTLIEFGMWVRRMRRRMR